MLEVKTITHFHMNIILLYRVERWLFEQHIPVLPKIVQLLIFLIFNSKITADSKIGKGTLRFSTVRQFPYKEVPHLKNNVWVGPNVIIAGPVVIEDDVIIAGNSFVNRSVPQGAIVAGCPAKIIGWRKNLDYAIETNPKYKEGHMPFLTK